ncbi:MAG: prephenate dehydrogenase/arogenate dehydrogenase family protein [Methylacidiphilales bacterium]|nr:prephenate dehydrogenase/arogenate dehydrogenase family protein [Candidatus Methylacidiphilales bacterium]
MNFGTVAILGPGLIGGSLALALAERGLAERLMIYARSPRALDAIRTAGVDAELTGNPSEAVRDADVVVLCVPIEAMAGLVHEIRDALKPTALVTDVGSVKGSVDRDLAPLLDDRALWIGSHPMAGSEQAGFAAARADLFEGASVIITPTQHTQSEAKRRAEQFWQSIGGTVVTLTPEKHDLHVAQISHLPHLLAAALVNQAFDEARELAGGGFRDTTRVASGSPELWTEILLANSKAVALQLDRIMSNLSAVESVLKGEDKAAAKSILFEMLKRAQHSRSKMTESNPLFKKR